MPLRVRVPRIGLGDAPVKVWIKVSGTWKLATPYTRVGGIWKITKPYIKIAGVWKGFSFDADALTYINAVETADGAALEEGVKVAINNFVVGCKADGIWTAIKASCILAGARTLSGALVPLVGTAPTNNGFVTADYNRKTGLVGNGSTKYLNSNRNNNADPQNNKHLSVYATQRNTEDTSRMYIGAVVGDGVAGDSQLFTVNTAPSKLLSRLNISATNTSTGNLHASIGLYGITRNNGSNYTIRGSGTNETVSVASTTPNTLSTFVFARNLSGTFQSPSDGRLAFYSLGESINLALLDARITTLINDYATAIP